MNKFDDNLSLACMDTEDVCSDCGGDMPCYAHNDASVLEGEQDA